MINEARKLLKQCKKAQGKPDSHVYIDTTDMCLKQHTGRTVVNDKSIKLKRFTGSLRSALQYLDDCGYISFNDNIIQVTFEGWHQWELTAKSIAWFAFKSILIPAAVAFLTSILTN